MRVIIFLMLAVFVVSGFAANETFGNTIISTTEYISTSDSLYAAKAVVPSLSVTATTITTITADSINVEKLVDDGAIAFKLAIGTADVSGRYAVFVDDVDTASIAIATVPALNLTASIKVTAKADSLILDVADADTTAVKGEAFSVIGRK